VRTVTPADLSEVIVRLLANAKAGDTAAAKLLLDRLLGPAESVDLLIRLETIEARTLENHP